MNDLEIIKQHLSRIEDYQRTTIRKEIMFSTVVGAATLLVLSGLIVVLCT